MGEPTDAWDHERYCAAAEPEMARFADLIAAADPAAPVPSCPGWTVADLAGHHGATYRWVEEVVRTGTIDGVAGVTAPEDTAEHPDWLRTGGAALLATLRSVGGDRAVWTWGPAGGARFWARRVLHETVIHRADAELALGRVPVVAAATAVDGIDEFLTNLPHADWLAERLRALPAEGTLHLHATDADGEWIVRLGPAGPSWERGHEKVTTAVRGDAGDLELLAYGRIRPPDERLTVFGDAALLDAWLAGTAF